jgi:thiol-disulfide isomerase/thioredoxin
MNRNLTFRGVPIHGNFASLLRAFVVIVLVVPQVTLAGETIEIHGFVDYANHNTQTGEALSFSKAHSSFVAKQSGFTWSVSVTNVERGFTWWAQRAYDGTNTYVLRPGSGNFWHTNPPDHDLQLATISPSAVALPLDGDPLGAALVSITYGLSLRSFVTNQIGLIEMPLPWTIVRDNPNAYGFKWLIHASEDGRFLNDFEVLREKALDLSEQEEFLRPQMDYPNTLEAYREYLFNLRYRKSSPQGYLRARYQCKEWYRTKKASIPRASKLEVYDPPNVGKLPARIFALEATDVGAHPGIVRVLPEITSDTAVADYRYKKANQTRIFKCAEYTLKSGDSWPPANDPVLLAKADDWLENGHEYAHFEGEAETLNKKAAEWETADIDGKKHSLMDYRGKVVVLDFWFRNCEPCIKAMPELKEIAQKFRDKPVAILGMNIDPQEKDARFVVDKLKLNYPTLKAEGLPEKYDVHGFPTLVIIDQEGVVRDRHVGYSTNLLVEVSKTINNLLADHN